MQITVAFPVAPDDLNFDPSCFVELMRALVTAPSVARILLAYQVDAQLSYARNVIPQSSKLVFLKVDQWISASTIMQFLEHADDGLLLALRGANIAFERNAFETFIDVAEACRSGVVYSDHRSLIADRFVDHPTTDYQIGSIRDTFDFGPLVFVSKWAAMRAINKYGKLSPDIRWHGFYALRLHLSIDNAITRVAEPLYTEAVRHRRPFARKATASFYVTDPKQREYQVEAEAIATAHLRRIGAHVECGVSSPTLGLASDDYPVIASVVVPVRNRAKTIEDSLQSALAQATSFSYNIIVVDDRSTDGSSEIIESYATRFKRVFHLIPKRRDLGIGGLWNEAIYSDYCGLYAIQMDSDDVYAHDHALEVLMREFVNGDASTNQNWLSPKYAMVLGSFTSVDADLAEISSGLDQRLELSRENLRNNLLCIDGPSAPRAFYVPVLRRFGFPNVSFGEDYATALRISRDYDVGRVFKSVYLVRQWAGNSTRTLPYGSLKSTGIEELTLNEVDRGKLWPRLEALTVPLGIASMNQCTVYKDYLRSVEIHARKRIHQLRKPISVDM